MTPTVLFIVGLILVMVDELRSRGQSLTGWAVVLICLGLLWGVIRL
jgi:hypothetical protein